ncbi:ALF repeat-containing protein [Nonomuraea rubra]
MRLVTAGGTWTRAAAEAALAGSEADLRTWLEATRATAAEHDDRSRVVRLADLSDKPALKAAAAAALAGTHRQVVQFLRLPMYEGKVQDDRIAIARLMETGGPATDAAAQTALNGTPADAHQFLRTGRHLAAEQDDRVAIARAMETGGAEVDAAAQAALNGPRRYLSDFLRTGLFKARQRDHDTALHVANVRRYVAEAAGSAALARTDAAEAARVAAIAKQAADEAAYWADKARESADQAEVFAGQAAQAAAEARQSADQAEASARTARDAANAAAQDAKAATRSAALADAAAARAQASAAAAYSAAERARASALEAGDDAAEAALAALDALNLAAAKQRAEDEERLRENTPPPTGPESGLTTFETYERGTMLVVFDDACYLNGYKLPGDLGVGSCGELASDFDRWLGDFGAFFDLAGIEEDDWAAVLLKTYCTGENNRGGDPCGNVLRHELRDVSMAPMGEFGGPGLFPGVGGRRPPLHNLAASRALFEEYKNILRAEMVKPHVVDSQLARWFEELWRPGATVGNGSTAAAVRFELKFGGSVGGAHHAQKARNYIDALEKWLRNNPAASPGDRAAAENVIIDLRNALAGK